MKKFIGLFLSGLVFMLGGCSNLVNTTLEVPKSTTTNETTLPNTTTLPDTTTSTPLSYTDDFGNLYLLNPTGIKEDYITSSNLSIEQMMAKVASFKEIVTGEINDVFQTKYEKGLLALFDTNHKVKAHIEITKKQLQRVEADNIIGGTRENILYSPDYYRICNLDISIDELVFHFENVGIREKGNTSRGNIFDGNKVVTRHYKLSFGETFDGTEYGDEAFTYKDDQERKNQKNRTFFGLDKLDIRFNKNREATYIREYSCYEMYRDFGLLSPRSNMMNVEMKIDGELFNLGLYLGIETVGSDFIKRNIVSTENDGDLYKCGWSGSNGATLNEVCSMGITDKTLGVEYVYDIKTNKKKSKHEALKTFINELNATSISNMQEFMNQYCLSDYFYTYQAIAYFLGDIDDFRGNYNNYYLYFMSGTGKMIMIPTDNDRALGTVGDGFNTTGSASTKVDPFSNSSGYAKEAKQKLLMNTIYTGANSLCKEKYVEQLKKVFESKWLSIDTYLGFFNQAKKHYQSIYTPSSNVSSYYVAPSMKESEDIYGNSSISIELYLKEKKNTCLNALESSGEEGLLTYYVMGYTDWSTSDFTGKPQLTKTGTTYSIQLTVNQNQAIKLYEKENKKWIGIESVLSDKTLLIEGDPDGNIVFKDAGTYTISYLTETSQISISKTN